MADAQAQAPEMDAAAAAKAAKRAEIMARLEAAKKERAEQDKLKAERSEKYGIHEGITCDGCNVQPIVGFRWHCKRCPNHDLCDDCYATFKTGKLLHANPRNNINKKVDAHEFDTMVDKSRKAFKPLARDKTQEVKKVKKIKPNAKCPQCASGKKYKKCCGKPGKK